MAYKITPNYFAAKILPDEFNVPFKLHSVSFDRCNFRCGFCNFENRHSEEYKNYSEEEFHNLVLALLKDGRFFKFTGGEPTLNRYLFRDIEFVKTSGGMVFLDTNGSNPNVIKALAEGSYIDVLGISIKGFDPDEAKKTTNTQNGKICWDNVFETLRIAEEYKVTTIVTMVFHKGIPFNRLYDFADLLEKYPNVRMKINNLLETDYQRGHFEKNDEVQLQYEIEKLIQNRPMWKGRITLVNSNDATTNNDAVVFL